MRREISPLLLPVLNVFDTITLALWLNRDWVLKDATCTHHGPILIYTSSGLLAFKCYFLYFSISIATNNIVGRMLTFNHYQFIHYFNLLALHCNVVVRHQLNFVTLQWKRYHFKRLDNTHGYKKKILAPNCQFPFLHCKNFNIAWSL